MNDRRSAGSKNLPAALSTCTDCEYTPVGKILPGDERRRAQTLDAHSARNAEVRPRVVLHSVLTVHESTPAEPTRTSARTRIPMDACT